VVGVVVVVVVVVMVSGIVDWGIERGFTDAVVVVDVALKF